MVEMGSLNPVVALNSAPGPAAKGWKQPFLWGYVVDSTASLCNNGVNKYGRRENEQNI
jgi:hypothetical protein